MQAWIAQAPVLVVALAVLFGPGLLAGLGLRLRGLALWALAPVLGTAALAALAIVYGAVGVPWSPLSIVAGCAGFAAAAWLVGLALGPREAAPRERRGLVLLAAGLAVGIVLGAARFGIYLGAPDAISQTNDAIFHLNALRWVLETGNASSFHLSGVLGARNMYPGAWHALASATALLTGASLPVAVNATSFAVAYVAWPVGIAWLARVATGSRVVAALAAALSTALIAFPLLMLEWGVLYPYGLSIALLPAAVAVVIATEQAMRGAGRDSGAEGSVRGAGRAREAARGGILVLAAAGALALAQPATLLAWGLLVLAWLTWWTARVRERRIVAYAALAASCAAFGVLWYVLTRTTSGAHWEPYRGRLAAVADVVLNAHMWLPPAVGVSVLCVAGLVVAVRRAELRWLATAWLVFSGLYVAVASVGSPFVRTWLLGAWYADPYRFAALAPVTVIPLAAIGLHAIVSWAAAALSRNRTVGAPSGRRTDAAEATGAGWSIAGVAAVGVAGLVAVPLLVMPSVFEDRWDPESRYASTAQSFLSPDERALLQRLPENVAEDALIIANPSTGAAFGYALSGRNVYPRTWQPPGGSWDAIAHGLRDAADDPAVCAALADFGSPDHVLDFGEGEASPGRYVMPGMTGFEDRPGFELVDREGDASLWRITACTA
ncbi:DUF6541 family protein [Microbacterium sp. No. 7]|uniref:DUF6541 family protein n=1 Tax=Microbacterium sp. No. 7 TaxID=1714373 RepID=UPI0006D271D9|nr:DUF6541 family protein [Microbacterium sp. No. 7]ALJ19377.1 hypothetical protein AOA12_05445 [Microbacterium sp. No. 7]